MLILGLGCNIENRLMNLRQALAELRTLQELTILQVSPVYESDALLPENADPIWNKPYLNVALRCSTSLSPEALLSKLKAIETKMGRENSQHWSPRVIDIDILAWDDLVIRRPSLHIPHKGLLDRPFALWPLADVAPDWKYCEPNTELSGNCASTLVKKWGSRFTAEAPLHTRQIAHRIDTPQMIGILNITPDSFSDGGRFVSVQNALEQAQDLFCAGADVIDIGAESTRPNAKTLTWQEEWSRLEPVLKEICMLWPKNSFRPKISIDTRNAEVAERALKYNIDFLNDVSGFTSNAMQKIAKESSAKLIYMHNLGIPPSPEKILDENLSSIPSVLEFAERQRDLLVNLGIKQERLIFDVGIGFGKTPAQSLELIANIEKFFVVQLPLLIGHSRKSFLTLFTNKPHAERDIETAVVSLFLAKKNLDYLRVHNVEVNMRALNIGRRLL